MSAHPILGLVALGYSPFIDSKRNVGATRLTVLPLRPDSALDATQLLSAVAEAWPEGGDMALLNIASETLLVDLMAALPPPNLMIEIPAFMAANPDHTDTIAALHAAGSVLLIKGRTQHALPQALLPCFKYAINDDANEGRVGGAMPGALTPAAVGRMAQVQAGVRTVAAMEAAFARGAAAVLGWPVDDAVEPAPRAKTGGAADLQVIVELIQGVDRGDAPDRLEAILKRDPTLAFKLMRYINSPGFGLAVEVTSFGHAIRLLGLQRLKRWLALLLATASKDNNLKPVMFAAVRRGLMMEELVRSSEEQELRNDMFICGVFSLLDRVFKMPFGELLKTIPVSQPVLQALVDHAGPLQPYLDMVRCIENESLYEFREMADRLLLSPGEINHAQLRAFAAAARLA